MASGTEEPAGPVEQARIEQAERSRLNASTDGFGPLVQRDYVAVVEGSLCTPKQVRAKLLTEFERFSPEALARFWRPAGTGNPLKVGDRMVVEIRGAGPAGVQITDVDDHSMTMRTVEGHPEAGRISFGADYDESGRVRLRIRSRSRLSGPLIHVGYELMAKHMQTEIWVTFLERLAAACGGRIIGEVLTSTDHVADRPGDPGTRELPTFDTGAEAA